jgi:hypothetical protein
MQVKSERVSRKASISFMKNRLVIFLTVVVAYFYVHGPAIGSIFGLSEWDEFKSNDFGSCWEVTR